MTRYSVLSSVLAAVIAVLGLSPSVAEAAWGVPYLARPQPLLPQMPPPPRVVRSAPDQSWLMDVPEKSGAPSRGKVAVFVINNDDVYQPVRAAVVRTLRRRGLSVTTTLRPVDSVTQYREMSQTLKLAVYVDGELTGEGARQHAVIHLRSGASGQRIASARFSGPTSKIVGEIHSKLWTRVGSSVTRACTSVARVRRPAHEPMHIDAGEPLDSPLSANGT